MDALVGLVTVRSTTGCVITMVVIIVQPLLVTWGTWGRLRKSWGRVFPKLYPLIIKGLSPTWGTWGRVPPTLPQVKQMEIPLINLRKNLIKGGLFLNLPQVLFKTALMQAQW
jgi:hypothetical protein